MRRRITGDKRGSFVLPGSNFFERPAEESLTAWKRDIAILDAEHQQLRNTVLALPRGLRERSRLHLIRGAAAHDLYHAGQIRLLRRMCPLER